MRYWLGVVCRDHVRRGVATPWPAGTPTETPVRNLDLDLTTAPNWGHQLRRGLVELTQHDYTAIRAALAGPR